MTGLQEVEELRAAGFEDHEIAQWATQKRNGLKEVGFTDEEINNWFGERPPDTFKANSALARAVSESLGRAEQGVLDLATIYGPLEAALHAASGLLIGFPMYLGAGVGSLIARGTGLSDDDPKEIAGKFAELVTYKPMTAAGERTAQSLMLPFTMLTEAAEAGGHKVTDAYDKPGRAMTAARKLTEGSILEWMTSEEFSAGAGALTESAIAMLPPPLVASLGRRMAGKAPTEKTMKDAAAALAKGEPEAAAPLEAKLRTVYEETGIDPVVVYDYATKDPKVLENLVADNRDPARIFSQTDTAKSAERMEIREELQRLEAERASATAAEQATPKVTGKVPDSAFTGDMEQSLRSVFNSDTYDGQPVRLSNRGFTQGEIKAMEGEGLATDGAMSPEQYAAWDRERGQRLRRAPTKRGVTTEERAKGIENRARIYDRLAQEQEGLAELGDAAKAAEYREKAAEIRSKAPRTLAEIDARIAELKGQLGPRVISDTLPAERPGENVEMPPKGWGFPAKETLLAEAQARRGPQPGDFGVPLLTPEQHAEMATRQAKLHAEILEKDEQIKVYQEELQAKGIEHPDVLPIMDTMAQNELGWAQIGGRHLGGPMGTPNFSTWIPRAEWWRERPDKKMNESATRAAVQKAIAGQKLKPIEKRAVDHMLQIAQTRAAELKRLGEQEWNEAAGAAREQGLEPTTQNVVEVDLVARASALDEAAVERAALQFENDEAGFLSAIKGIVDERASATTVESRQGAASAQERPGAATPAGEPAPGRERPAAPAGEPTGPITGLTALPVEEQPAAIGRAIEERLRATGVPEAEAKANAALWESFFRSAGERYNRPPADLLESYLVKIQAGELLTPEALSQEPPPRAPLWYSELARQLEASPMKSGGAKAWKDYIKGLGSKGVKTEEIKWSGIEEWLDIQEGKVTKEQVAEFLKAGGVKVEEVQFGEYGRQPETKFGQYQLPGGKEYRELLLTLPEKPLDRDPAIAAKRARFQELVDLDEGNRTQRRDLTTAEVAELNRLQDELNAAGPNPYLSGEPVAFESGHFPDVKNPIAHIRFNERTAADGKRTLFIEEIQSDWAQKGKKEGFVNAPERARVASELKKYDITVDERTTITTLEDSGVPVDLRTDWWNAYMKSGTIPSAPFVGKTESWVALSLKRMIRYAAENGFDRIAWTTGEQQVTRYQSALRKEVDSIEWTKTPEGVQLVGYKGRGPGPEPAIEQMLAEQRSVISQAPKGSPARWELKYSDDSVAYFDSKPQAEFEIIRQWRKDHADEHTKVVDTTQKETELSDAIGKAMADQIRNDPAQSGVIEGENIRIDDTGMATFYDRIVPNVANDVLKKLGGGKVGKVDLGISQAPRDRIDINTDITRGDVPELRMMTDGELEAFQGATDFEHLPNMPLIAETKILVNGERRDATVSVDESGLHIVDATAENEFLIPRQVFETAGHAWDNATAARRAVENLWRAPAGTIWANVEHIIGDAEVGPYKSEKAAPQKIEQQSVEITPALRERASKAMPLFQEGEGAPRGQIEFGERGTIISLLETADRSTFLHETGHFFLQVTRDLAGSEGAPALARHDWKVLSDWLALEEGAEIPRAAHEKFAEGFEQYLAEGKAPSPALRSIFEQFRDWLLEIYTIVKDAGLSDDVRGVFDRMLTSQTERPASAPPPPPTAPPPRPPQSPPPSDPQRAVLERISMDPAIPRRYTWEEFYADVKDDLWPIKNLVDELRQGTALGTAEDPYKLARLTRGAFGRATQFLEYSPFEFKTLQNVGKSLKDVLDPVKDDLDGLRAYAVSRRSLELAEREIVTGVPLEEARAVVEQGAKYEAVLKDLQEYQDHVLAYMKDSGIFNDAQIAAMREANKDYVPFYRLMEDAEGQGGAGPGLSVRSPIKRIKGSERKIIDPLESIVKNTYLYTALADRNAVGQALVALAERSGRGEELVQKVKQPVRPIEIQDEEMSRFLEAHGIEAPEDTLTVFRRNSLVPEHDQIVVFTDGKREVYQVPEEVATAFKATDRETAGMLTQILAIPARMLRAGATLSPDFISRNPVRDQFSAYVLSKNGYVPVLDLARGFVSIAKHDTDFQNWLKSGGANAAMLSMDRDYVQAALAKHTGQLGFYGKTWNIVKNPLEPLAIASEVMEAGTRMGEFKKGVKAMTSKEAIQYAGFESREVTLDFARQGARTRSLNMITAFWNAQLEGMDRVVRAIKERPLQTMTAIATSITLPSVLLWWANHDDRRWKEIPNWQRDLFWIILTEDHIYRIPKPFELGVIFGSSVERILDAFYDDKPDSFKDFSSTMVSTMGLNFMPTVASPVVGQIVNWNFFTDRPLVSSSMEKLLPEYQYSSYTTQATRALGHIIGAIPGMHDKSLASPMIIDNYIRAWTGTLGVYALQTADLALRKTGVLPDPIRPASTLADMPVLRGFMVRYPSGQAQSIQDFYDAYDKATKVLDTIRHLARQGDAEAALREASIDPDKMVRLKGIHEGLGNAQRTIQLVDRNPNFPADEKRQLIDTVYYQMIAMAGAGNATLREMKVALDKASKDRTALDKQFREAGFTEAEIKAYREKTAPTPALELVK